VNDSIVGGVKFRVFRHPLLKDVGNVGYCASPATIAAKPDVLKRFARAIVESALFVRINPSAAALLYVKGSGQKVTMTRSREQADPDRAPRRSAGADPSNPRIGYFNPRNVTLYSNI